MLATKSPAFKVINDGGTKRNVQTWESSIDYFTILFDGELVEEKMKKTDKPRYLELSKDKGKSIIHQHSPETPLSPRKAEDFLSLALCSSSSDIIQMLSTNGLLSQFDQYDQNEMHDEVEEQEVKSIAKSERSSNLRKEQTWLNKWYKNVKWNQKQGGILSKTNTMNRNKELANQRSKAKAALLVTRLAAAITSIAATGNFETNKHSCMIRGNGIDNKMSKAVASAAALVVNVCAEVAESFGAASKAHIASAVTSGLATQSSVDIAALTARAATVLGGESTSYLTAGNTSYVPEKKMLARGVLLPVQTPSGKIEQRIASIFHKHDRLVLKLGKMHLGGVFTTYKEYGILAIVDEEIHGHDKDAHDSKKITLHTTGGVVKLNFNDRKQCRVWKSTISHLLCESSVSNICIDTNFQQT